MVNSIEEIAKKLQDLTEIVMKEKAEEHIVGSTVYQDLQS
jgi:uncharacterized protein YaaR (DUF327 family)